MRWHWCKAMWSVEMESVRVGDDAQKGRGNDYLYQHLEAWTASEATDIAV